MADLVKFKGVKEIIKAMQKTNFKLGILARHGLIKAGLFLQRQSQKIVPIETSTLKNSAGTRALGSGWMTAVVVFYTASYAVYVHERTELRHAPGKKAKFLEEPARRYMSIILRIISGEMENLK